MQGERSSDNDTNKHTLWLGPWGLLLMTITGAVGFTYSQRDPNEMRIGRNPSYGVPKDRQRRREVITPTGFDFIRLFDRNNWLVADSKSVYKTQDGGESWTEIYVIKGPQMISMVSGA